MGRLICSFRTISCYFFAHIQTRVLSNNHKFSSLVSFLLQKHHKPKNGDHYSLLFASVFVNPLYQQCFLDLKSWRDVCRNGTWYWKFIHQCLPRLNNFPNNNLMRLRFVLRALCIFCRFLYSVISRLQDVHSLPRHGRVWRVWLRSLQTASGHSGERPGQGQGQEHRETAV